MRTADIHFRLNVGAGHWLCQLLVVAYPGVDAVLGPIKSWCQGFVLVRDCVDTGGSGDRWKTESNLLLVGMDLLRDRLSSGVT